MKEIFSQHSHCNFSSLSLAEQEDYVQTFNDYYFAERGVTREEVERRYDAVCKRAGIETNFIDSIHGPAITALELTGFRPKHILELGTHWAVTTVFLSELFPEAKIFTLDLPSDDPIYGEWHPEGREEQQRISAERLERENIFPFSTNTMNLLELDLPRFDLIWLDAGHFFPEVAWDHFYCVSKLEPGGWLFTDDVYLPDGAAARSQAFRADVHTVLEYYNARQEDQFRLLLKREVIAHYGDSPKFVGFLKKHAA